MDFNKITENILPKIIFGIVMCLFAFGKEFYDLKTNVSTINELDKQQNQSIHEIVNDLITKQQNTNNLIDKQIFQLNLRVDDLVHDNKMIMNDYYFRKHK